MSKRQRVRAVVVGLVAVGTAFGVVAGLTDGQWTTAATGFAYFAGADVLWTHLYAQPVPGRRRRAVSLGLLVLALCGLAAAFVAGSGVQRVGLVLMGLGVVLCVAFAVGSRRSAAER